MEDLSLIIWSAAAGVVLAIVVPYIWALARRQRLDKQRLAEAREGGRDRPMMQYPYVDPAVCIGCGGCIKACPEKDVLGIVGGLAVVVNGASCIGIGQCAKACPVQAIDLRVGDLRGRADVPMLTPDNETTVPGLFIAGELGGLALVRNAIGQGRDTVRHIAERIAETPPEVSAPQPVLGQAGDNPPLDLIIVGAGPAGLSAALSASAAGLSYLVLEQQESLGGTIYQYPRRKLTHTQPVEIPLYGELRKPEYSKEELLELFEGLVERHDLQIRFRSKVQAVDERDSPDAPFTVRTLSGDTHVARYLLLALGRRGTPRKLGAPGEKMPKVLYQVRDAEQYSGLRILCVGGGDSAIEAAMGLARQAGNEVTISYRKDQFFRIKQKNRQAVERMIQRGRLRVIFSSNVSRIDAGVVHLDTPDGSLELANDMVFVMVGGEAPFPFLKKLGVRFWDQADAVLEESDESFLPRAFASAQQSN